MTLQVFTEGYTNTLIGCRLREDASREDVVLIRIYGRGTEVMIDRDQERNAMAALHRVGLGSPVYCQFDNGIAYGFQPGHMLNPDSVRQPHMQR